MLKAYYKKLSELTQSKLTKTVVPFFAGLVVILIPIFLLSLKSPIIVHASTLFGLNEGYGTTVYGTGTTVTGTITNAVWKSESDCLSGNCLYFDGTGDYVSLGDSSEFDFTASANWSIDFWFRTPDITTGTRMLISKYLGSSGTDGGYKIYMDSDGKINFAIDDDNTWGPDDIATSTGAYDDSGWHHVEVTKTGTSNIKLYVDAVLVGQNDSTTADATLENTDNLYIGIDGDASSNPFIGFIDELKAHTTEARSQDQVRTDYISNSSLTGTSAKFGSDKSYLTDGLVGHWKMDENTGASATDASGNNNTAALTNSPSWSEGKYGRGVSFDGTNDYASAADSASLSVPQGFSVAGWAKMDETFSGASDYNQGIVDKGDYKFYLDKSDGKAKWVVNDAVAKAFSAIEASGEAIGVTGTVNALTIYNGYLYVGGTFTTAGGTTVNNIAKYDDATNTFSAIGGATKGTNSIVHALTVYNGYLYVGGLFTTAGGTTVNRIAKYDDATDTFSAIGGATKGTSDEVGALTIYNGYLYVGGSFITAGGTTVNYIAKYDDATDKFSAIGGATKGTNGEVSALTVYNGYLYVGGFFTTAGGTTVNNIAKYDDATDTFSAIGGATKGTNYTVKALTVYNGYLYVGGFFTTAGGTTVNRIAKYDDATDTFSAIGGATKGTSGYVYSLAVYNEYLYVGGLFTTAGGTTVNYIAKYDDATDTFSAIGGATKGTSGEVGALTIYNGNLYVGGGFNTAGGTTANRIAKYDDTEDSFSYIRVIASSFGTSDLIYCLTVYNGYLYVGGSFTTAGGTTVNRIAKYDDATDTFSAIGGNQLGTDNLVKALAVYNGYLYVGGSLITAGGTTVNYIAKYDDATDTFSAIGGATKGTDGEVYSLAVYNGYLYVGGTFETAGGVAVNQITKYNSATDTFSTVSSGMSPNSSHVQSMAVYHQYLYIGGLFSSAGGTTVNNIAKYNDATDTFSAIGGATKGTSGVVSGLTVYNGNLYVGGIYATAGGTTVNNIAKYNDATNTFSAIGGATAGTSSSANNALAVYNGYLYVGGSFTTAGGTTVNRIAKYDDATDTFSAIGGATKGTDDAVNSLAIHNGHLYVGGTFDTAGGTTVNNLTKYGSSTPNVDYSVSSATESWTANTWYHLAGVYDGKNVIVYVNGKREGTTSNLPLFTASDQNQPLLLGKTYGSQVTDSSDELFDGTLDDFRVYNRALSSREIANLYSSPADPAAWWKLDENTGNYAYDSSGNNAVSSAFSGNVQWDNGRIGGALVFDGDNDVVSVAEVSSIDLGTAPSSYTISTWVKTVANTAGEQTLVAKNDGSGAYPFNLYLNSSESVCFKISDGTNLPYACGGAALNDGNWLYVTGVRDSVADKIYLYFNGIAINAATDTTTAGIANNDNVTFGNSGTSYTANDLNGSLDDIKIYNYARTPAQIIQDMNAGHPTPGSPIGSAYIKYKFDEGYGTTANNAGFGGSNLNGLISGGTWTNSGKFDRALSLSTGSKISTTLESPGFTHTTALWIYPTASIASKTIIASGDTPKLTTDSSSRPVYGGCVGATLSLNAWTHLIAVSDAVESDTCAIYQNGKLILSGTTGVTLEDPVSIGNGTNTFTGAIDEFKIYYGIALDADQAKVEYNQGVTTALGSLSTDAAGNASNSAGDAYCPPGQNTACTGPIRYWPLDENTGTSVTYDKSGSTAPHNGTLAYVTQEQWVAGKKGSALKMYKPGVNDAISFGDINELNGADEFTITAWLKEETFDDWAAILSRWGSDYDVLGVSYGSQGTLYATLYNTESYSGVGTATNAYNTGEWFHLSVVYNGNGATNADKLKMYINGVTETLDFGSTTIPSTLGSNSSNFITGEVNSTVFDDVKIYNYARTPAQVAWDYNRGDPIARYKFDDCAGTTLNESSRRPNPGSTRLNGTINIGTLGGYTQPGTCSSEISSDAWNAGTTGKFGSALAFDGIDDYISIANDTSFDLTGDFSASVWYKPANTFQENTQGIMDNGQFSFKLEPNNAISGTVAGTAPPGLSNTPTMGDGNQTFSSLVTYNDKLYGVITPTAGLGAGIYMCDPARSGTSKTICDDPTDWSLSLLVGSSSAQWGDRAFIYKGYLYNYLAQGYDLIMCIPESGGNARDCDAPEDWGYHLGSNVRIPFVFNNYLYKYGISSLQVCNPATAENPLFCDNENDWTDVYTLSGGLTQVRRAIQTYNGYLYLGTATSSSGDGNIYLCDPSLSGDSAICDESGDWSISYDGTNQQITGIVEFNGYLYASEGYASGDGNISVCNPSNSGNAKKCDSSGDWTLIYDGTSDSAYILGVYNGTLLADPDGGESSRIMICDPSVGGTSVSICDHASDWTLTNTGSIWSALGGQEFNGIFYLMGDNAYVNGLWYYNGGGGATYSAPSSQAQQWSMATITKAGSTFSLYSNGGLKATHTMSFTTGGTNSFPLLIGKTFGDIGDGNFFEGLIDDIQLFNYPLTGEQVKNIYNNNSAVHFD